MKLINRLAVVVVFMLNAEQSFSEEYRESLDVHIPSEPQLVNIDGKPTAYYELYLTSFSVDSIRLKKLEVLGADDSSILVTIDKDNLRKRISKIGASQKGDEATLLPGSTIVIYLEIALPKSEKVRIAHRLEFEISGEDDKQSRVIECAEISLSTQTDVVLGAPLGSGYWAAVYEPSWEKGHRRVIYTENGKARIPGRFAIDFIKLDDKGRYTDGDEDVIKNWYGYGADVLAVANGRVMSSKNDFPESPTLSDHPKYTADEGAGNYIAIDMGSNRFVFYEHLKPGSIRVQRGQKVSKGDVIACVGFTGQTQGPHLHFHMADGNLPLGAEGIPFVFEHFAVSGSYNDFKKFGKELWMPLKNLSESQKTAERPAPNSVIRFRGD